jgi:hypothetical protein
VSDGGHHFCGILGRVETSGDDMLLRLYPWSFDANPTLKPVFQVCFHKPNFEAEILRPFELEELDLEVHSSHADLWTYAQAEPTRLVAASVEQCWQPYAIVDLAERIGQLDRILAETGAALGAARRRAEKTHSLIAELIRRAEIKADASPELRAREAAVISALQRVLAKLGEE